MAYTRTVHTVTPKTSDIEVHVSTLEVESGDKYTDIREYVVSLGQYGRGITFPAGLTGGIEVGIHQASNHQYDPS